MAIVRAEYLSDRDPQDGGGTNEPVSARWVAVMVCPRCSRPFVSERSVRSHRIKTPACAYGDAERKTDAEHQAAHRERQRLSDGIVRRHPCPGCGRRFASAYALGAHRGHQQLGSSCRPEAGPTATALARKQRRRRRRLARRRYARLWRAAHPGYHDDWRRQHPEVERRRRRRWRAANRERHNAAERARRSRQQVPTLHQGHELFERARAIVLRFRSEPSPRRYFEDSTWDDAIGTAVLALLDGTDARVAVQCYLRDEAGRYFRSAQLSVA